MRTLLCLVTCGLLLVAATACTSLDSAQPEAQAADGTPTTQAAAPAQPAPPRRPPAYRNAERVCTAFSLKEMASYYGTARRPAAVAKAHAEELYATPRLRRQAVRGCLAAFRAR